MEILSQKSMCKTLILVAMEYMGLVYNRTRQAAKLNLITYLLLVLICDRGEVRCIQ